MHVYIYMYIYTYTYIYICTYNYSLNRCIINNLRTYCSIRITQTDHTAHASCIDIYIYKYDILYIVLTHVIII